MAQSALTRAKAEIASGETHRLRYAALELRDALEALVYDRARALRAEIPPQEYATWQPRQLMRVIADIDPKLGMTSILRVAQEEKLGQRPPPGAYQTLGTDHVVTIAELKATYDKLGSYLHMPSLAQLQKQATPDPAKLKALCDEVIAIVERVVSSRVWNSTLGVFATLDACMNEECGKPIRKRIPAGQTELDVKCFHCAAEYKITSQAGGRVLWMPKQIDAECSAPQCKQTMPLWPHELLPGTNWRCKACGTHNRIDLGVTAMPNEKVASSAVAERP